MSNEESRHTTLFAASLPTDKAIIGYSVELSINSASNWLDLIASYPLSTPGRTISLLDKSGNH
jgi:hypothetical protein